MTKKITLPSNWFGLTIFLLLIALTFIVPFVLTHWLVGLFAPEIVAIVLAVAAGLACFLKCVKFKD